MLIVNEAVETPENFPIVSSTSNKAMNTPFWVRQLGTTLSFSVTLKKWQIKPYVTMQRTTLHDYTEYTNTSDVAPSPTYPHPQENNMYSGIGTTRDHKMTPSVYGGASVNYKFKNWNFNMNSYFFTRQAFYHPDNLMFKDGVSGIGEIKAKAIINAKVSYSPLPYLSVFLSGQNMLNNKSVEYYISDETPAMWFGGVSLKF